MRIKQHKESGLWVTDDGRVVMPPCPKYPKFRFTYGSKGKKGYMRVCYRGKDYRVHCLIAQTFLENPANLPEVDHKDRNPQNNKLSNLRFADRKMQNNNRQVCEDSLAKYGVRHCDNHNAYQRALYANNPEFAEREKARKRERYANDPEFAERRRALVREYIAKQKALGKRRRKCPDGKTHRLTDEEYTARFGNKPRQMQLF